MTEVGGSRGLYSIVQLALKSSWRDLIKDKDGKFLQVTKNPNMNMGQDSLGNYWASLRFTEGVTPVSVRITYLTCDSMSMSKLLECHSSSKGLEPYNHSSGLFSSKKENPTDNFKGVRILPVKRELTTTGMRHVLGATNDGWICAGAQAQGLFQMNSEGLNLEVKSVVVATYRGGDPVVDSNGYLEFYESSSEWPYHKFTCMYEVLVDDQLVFATLCNEKHSVDANK
jgi:hypothetical protein